MKALIAVLFRGVGSITANSPSRAAFRRISRPAYDDRLNAFDRSSRMIGGSRAS